MDVFEKLRKEMVENQIAARGIKGPTLLNVMSKVPREAFVGESWKEFAYEDRPLPIEEGQTISQPYIVAFMAQSLNLQAEDRVLEIGTGSGYGAAVLSRLVAYVYTVESLEKLARAAKEKLHDLGYSNVSVHCADGSLGWKEHAPYQGIIVTAGGPYIPPALLKQLAVGGRLVIPIGSHLESQYLIRVTKVDQENYSEEVLGAVRFVPLIGEAGWKISEIK